MYDVVTFGEAMIRLSSPGIPPAGEFHQSGCRNRRRRVQRGGCLRASGAEYGVGIPAGGQLDRVDHSEQGPGTRRGHVQYRLGWILTGSVSNENGFYHVELGVGPRASAVTYDRANSAISNIEPGMVDWKSIFEDAKWFHVSGITPALSDSAANTTLEALEAASDAGVTTSYDLNFRSKLWSSERAQETSSRIVPLVKVLIGNEEDFEKVLGLKAEGSEDDYSQLDPESYKDVARRAVERYPNVDYVGTTLRVAKTGLLNDWRTLLFDGDAFYLSRIFEDLEMVDRVGGGDSFSAGLISSLIEGVNPQSAVDFAGAYSALAHTFLGDVNWATRAEAESAMKGAAARIRR